MEEFYYYRGTTEGWTGNACLMEQEITCTSTDPIVATLFAIECRSHGPGVILIAPTRAFEGRLGAENYKSVEECAVNLLLTPEEFSSQILMSLGVDLSMDILGRLGHEWLPARLNGRSALREALDESSHRRLRLNPEQIREFNRMAFGECR